MNTFKLMNSPFLVSFFWDQLLLKDLLSKLHSVLHTVAHYCTVQKLAKEQKTFLLPVSINISKVYFKEVLLDCLLKVCL